MAMAEGSSCTGDTRAPVCHQLNLPCGSDIDISTRGQSLRVLEDTVMGSDAIEFGPPTRLARGTSSAAGSEFDVVANAVNTDVSTTPDLFANAVNTDVSTTPDLFVFDTWKEVLDDDAYTQHGAFYHPVKPTETLAAAAWMDRYLRDPDGNGWPHYGLLMVGLFSTAEYNEPYLTASPEQRIRMLCYYASSTSNPLPPDLLPPSSWQLAPDLQMLHDLHNHDWNEDLQEFHNSDGCPE